MLTEARPKPKHEVCPAQRVWTGADTDALVAGPGPEPAPAAPPSTAVAELLRALVFEARAGIQARWALAPSATARGELAERAMRLDDLLGEVLAPDGGDPVAVARLVA